MKSVKSRLTVFLCFVTVLWGMAQSISIASDHDSTAECLIKKYIECRNNKNVDEYVQLFSSDIQREMKDYIDECGYESFFIEEDAEILSIKEGDASVALEEKGMFQDVKVYEVTENITYKKDIRRSTCALKNGININNYVLVKENGKWYLHRISAACVPESE